MKILLPLLAVPAVLALSPTGTRLALAPEEGLVLTKRFEVSSVMEIEEMSMSMDGNDMGDAAAMDQTTTIESTVVLVDHYQEVEDGRVTKLKRTFDEIARAGSSQTSHPMMGDIEMDMVSATDLEGVSVVFTWDPDAGEYAVDFAADSGGDPDLLLGLVMDTDLARFLPRDEVDEEDSWDVPPAAMRDVIVFAGDLKSELEAEDEMGMGSQKQPSPDELLGELEGSVVATFKGTREEDGVEVAVIHLVVDVRSAKDVTELFREMSEDVGNQMGVETEYDHVDAEIEFDGEGTLLWHLAGDRVHSFELSGRSRVIMDMMMTMSAPDQEMEMEMHMVMVGDDSYSLEVVEGAR